MKITKVLLGGSLAIPAVAVPLTTLTSCNQTWGNLTPFTIGSIDAKDGYAPYSLLTDPDQADADGGVLAQYLQSNYTIHNAKSLSYAYSSPMKFVDRDAEKEEAGWEEGTSGWYVSSDANLASSASDKYINADGKKVTKTVTCARNAALAGNIDFVSTIATSINSYISNAWQYQASQVNTNDLQGDHINIAWGSSADRGYTPKLSHGTLDKQIDGINNKYYESIYSLANINGTNASKSILRTTSVNFNFKQMPIPAYTFENYADVNTRRISPKFIELLEGKDGNIGDAAKYYTSKKLENKDGDFIFDTYTYEAVPVQVKMLDLTQTFINPSPKIDSILVSDYYQNDVNEINSSIGDAWKGNGKEKDGAITKFTGLSDEQAKPHFKKFVLNATNTGKPLVGKSQDERIKAWADFCGSDFVALVSYTVNVYRDHPEKNTAVINTLQYVFPSYFLDLYDDLYKDNEQNVKIFDTKKLDKVMKNFRDLFEHTGKEGYIADVTKLSQESKNLLLFLSYVFDKDGVVDANNFLDAKDPINR